ncbi:hypothetical protein [Aquibium oceanicum]|uniref:hypothetical protein n=1 Tax=Aquibium oceanicum TaxID=1670800 RepID=UPI0012FFCB30|nr:hypothetical protein [Aquibium oceanicum]
MGEGHADWTFGRAEETLLTADRLRQNGRDWPNIYYLSGLAVEHALWAIRVRRAMLTSPDYHKVTPHHDLNKIAVHCGLVEELKRTIRGNRAFHMNWRTVCDWDNNSRYQRVSAQDAKDMCLAVNNPTSGVMPWLRNIYQTG